jgi:hypothetical protein
VRQRYQQNRLAWQTALDAQFKSMGIDKIDVVTDADYLPAVHSFFKKRAARR